MTKLANFNGLRMFLFGNRIFGLPGQMPVLWLRLLGQPRIESVKNARRLGLCGTCTSVPCLTLLAAQSLIGEHIGVRRDASSGCACANLSATKEFWLSGKKRIVAMHCIRRRGFRPGSCTELMQLKLGL